MDCVQAGRRKPSRYFDGIVDGVPHRAIEECIGVMVIDAAQLDRHEEILTDCGAHGRDHFQQESCPSAQLAAIVVRAVVDGAGEKLVEDVSVTRDNLDAIGSSLASATRSSAVIFGEFLYFRYRHAAAAQSIEEIRLVG